MKNSPQSNQIVSTNTLVDSDLLRWFAAALSLYDPDNPLVAEAETLAGKYGDFGYGSELDDEDSLTASYLVNEALPDALDALSPPGHYFGAHPGDGSCFGWWPVETED